MTADNPTIVGDATRRDGGTLGSTGDAWSDASGAALPTIGVTAEAPRAAGMFSSDAAIAPLGGAVVSATFSPSGASPQQARLAVNAANLQYTGAGVTVGIMSDSFARAPGGMNNVTADQQHGLLPGNVSILKDYTGSDTSEETDEGRAMAQIVHDIAPGANVDFYSAANSEQDFANGILALAAAGAKVICDDVSYFDEPFFQTDVIANAIQTVEQQGVIFVTCATNFGSEGYQSTWNPIASTVYDGVTLTDTQNFGGSPVQAVTIGSSAGATPFILEWNQPYGTVSSNTANLALVAFENGSYVGTFGASEAGNPFIALNLPVGTYQFAVENLSGPSHNPGLIEDLLFANGSEPYVSLGGANSGTVVGHHMSPYAITVGAVNSANTPGNGGSLQNEYYSSSGAGTQLWFNYDGTPVAGGPLAFNPVAVSGIDDISTSVTGLTDFFGTSAATPSVAAIVADMLQANPSLTEPQVKAMLQASATAFGNSGVAGSGLVNAALAVQAAEAASVKITVQNMSVAYNQSVALSSIFSVSGNGISQYQVWFSWPQMGEPAFGSVTNNGTPIALDQPVVVSSLSGLQFIGAATPGTDHLWLSAYAGQWTPWAEATLADQGIPPPTVTATNQTVAYNQSVALSSIFSVSGSASQYQVWFSWPEQGDPAFGTVTNNGTPIALDKPVIVSSLSGLQFTGSATTGTDHLWVSAYNGQWGSWAQATLTDQGIPPAVMRPT